MTNEANPEDSRKGPTEAEHHLLDASAQLTLSARQSQEHADESEQCYLGQREANQPLLNEAATIAIPGIRIDPERAATAQTPGESAARFPGSTHSMRRIEGCTCGISPAGTDPFLISALEEILDAFERSLDERTLMAELSPPVLHEWGLSAALQSLAESMVKHGLKVELCLSPGPLSLRENEHVLLYQSVRELLINCAKHAKTPRARLSLSVEGMNHLQIVVSDHGSGFEVETLNARPLGVHCGLFSIRERMEAMGGFFHLDSAPGDGTMITLTLPMRTE